MKFVHRFATVLVLCVSHAVLCVLAVNVSADALERELFSDPGASFVVMSLWLGVLAGLRLQLSLIFLAIWILCQSYCSAWSRTTEFWALRLAPAWARTSFVFIASGSLVFAGPAVFAAEPASSAASPAWPVTPETKQVPAPHTTNTPNTASPAWPSTPPVAPPTVPGPDSPAKTPPEPPRHHTVQVGESLWRIASMNTDGNISKKVQELYACNKSAIGNNPDHIEPGLVLELP